MFPIGMKLSQDENEWFGLEHVEKTMDPSTGKQIDDITKRTLTFFRRKLEHYVKSERKFNVDRRIIIPGIKGYKRAEKRSREETTRINQKRESHSGQSRKQKGLLDDPGRFPF